MKSVLISTGGILPKENGIRAKGLEERMLYQLSDLQYG